MSKNINFEEPLSPEDAQYVAERPWLLQDAELRGIDVVYADDYKVDDETADETADEDPEDPEDPEDEEEDVEEEDLEALSVDELKSRLRDAGKPVSGSKEQLIERLTNPE